MFILKKEIIFDIEYVAKKLDWSPKEFKAIIGLPPAQSQRFSR